MDTTNCPSGWATDRWILDHSLIEPCGVPVALFYLVFALFLVLKTYILYHTWQFWLKRYREMKRVEGALAQRHPIVPALLTFIAIQYVLTMALVGSNIASVRNGGGTALYALTTTTWGIYTLFHVKKYLSLGRKLIPLALAQFQGVPGEASDSGEGGQRVTLTATAETKLSILSKLDLPLQVIMSLMVIAACMQFGFGIVAELVDPLDERWMRVLFAWVCCYAFLLYVCLMWHLERLLNATKICSSSIPASTIGGKKVARAIRIMRTNQVVWFTSGNISFITQLLMAISVADPSWIYILCMYLIETLASAFAFLSTRRMTRTKRKPVATPLEKISSNPHNNRDNDVTGQTSVLYSPGRVRQASTVVAAYEGAS